MGTWLPETLPTCASLKYIEGVRVQVHSFITSALVEVSGQVHAWAALPWERTPTPPFLLVPTSKYAGYATEPVRTFWNKEKNALVPILNLIFPTVLCGTTPTRAPSSYADENNARYIKGPCSDAVSITFIPCTWIRNEPRIGAYPEFFPRKWREGGFDPETTGRNISCFSFKNYFIKIMS